MSGEEVKHDQCDGHRKHDDDCSKRVCLHRDLDFERVATVMSRCRLLKSPIELSSPASAHSQEEKGPVDESDDSDDKPGQGRLQELDVRRSEIAV